MSIVTKTGDSGDTGLFGGQRISKADTRIHAYGTVDELNAVLGIIIAEYPASPHPGTGAPTYETKNSQKHPSVGADLANHLIRIQNILFRMGADLATPRIGNANPPRIEPEHVQELEEWVKELESSMEMPQYFVLPGGTKTASFLHLARTICRRAERLAVDLAQKEDIGPHVVIYLNRLSDYLFLASLRANMDEGVADVRVTY